MSSGILHLGYPPFTPVSSWIHDTLQANIQGLRIKIKNLFNKEKYDSVFFSSLPYVDALSSSSFHRRLPHSSYHRRRPPSSYHRPKQPLFVVSLNNPQITFSLLLKHCKRTSLSLVTNQESTHPRHRSNHPSPFLVTVLLLFKIAIFVFDSLVLDFELL
jgi:hypothetical protein